MPPAIPLLVAGLGTFATGIAALGVAAGTFASFAIGAVASFALSSLSSALSPSAGGGGGFATIRNNGITRQVRQPITERRVVYGEARTSGPMALITSSEDNVFLHIVILLSNSEVEEIGEISINNVSITDDMLDGDNIVNTGLYDGLIRIKKHLGSDDQLADSELVAEVPEWTNEHRLRGIAYMYLRLEWDRDTFPGGIPNFSAWVKGKRVFDTRDSVTRWTPNNALIARDFLIDTDYGLAATSIDDSTMDSTANTCDEFVETNDIVDAITSADDATNIISLTGMNDRLSYQTGDRVRLTGASLPAGLALATDYYVIVYQRKDTPRIKLAASYADSISGVAVSITGDGTGTITKKAEPRYQAGGIVKSDAAAGRNLQELLTGMGGSAVWSGGSWRLRAGEYIAPVLPSFTVDDMIGSMTIQSKQTRRDRFNTVTGVYISPINDGNPSDYPVIKNDTYIAQDQGETLRKAFDLGFTQRPHTAQRLAKIDLERSRQEIVFSSSFKLNAFKLDVGDNFMLTEAKYGWVDKVFEVISWKLNLKAEQVAIEITARENAPEVYDWNMGEETRVDPAPNSNLPNPFEVSPPTSLSVLPIEIGTANGDLTYEFKVGWTASTSAFVINGGHYDVQFKRSSEADWNTSFRAEDDDTNITVKQVQPAVNYDVRIRAVNSLGVRSVWQNLLGFNVSSPSGATLTLDYGFTTGGVVDIIDYRFAGEAVEDSLDYGSVD